MKFRLFGSFEVLDGDNQIQLGRRPRRLVTILLLHSGTPVSRDKLMHDMYGEEQPSAGENALEALVSAVRKEFGPCGSLIQTEASPRGYSIATAIEDVDVHLFKELVRDARTVSPELAQEQLRQALDLWRGPPLEEFLGDEFARTEITELHALRREALERMIDIELDRGHHTELIAELEVLVADYPLHEAFRAQLMLALYRSHRQAEALDVFRDARRLLSEELGLEPGERLQKLQRAILSQDPALLPDEEEAVEAAAAGSLPVPQTSFLGREGELSELAVFMREDKVRLLTLTGSGGSGKTRLAVELAARERSRFPDGVFWVPLQTLTDPGQVTSEIAHAVGIDLEGTTTPIELLAGGLRGKRLLLVIDNFEQVMDAAIEIGALLTAVPGLRVLVTSRSPLHLAGEQEFEVPPMKEQEAVGLFSARARESDAHFDGDPTSTLLVEICRRVDCLPLAIELAAMRVRLLPPDVLLDRLDAALGLLIEGPRDAPERQRTLRATIDWSYLLLTEWEQTVFLRLSVFTGGCQLEAAEAICDATLGDLQSLIDVGLLRRFGVRYRMLETVREYASSLLAESGESADMARRHAHFYLGLAEHGAQKLQGRGQQDWFTKLESERNNLRAALAHVMRAEDSEVGLRFVVALRFFWIGRGYLAEGRDWLELALQQDTRGPSVLRARALGAATAVAIHQGDLPQARVWGQDRLEMVNALGDRQQLAWASVGLAGIARATGDYDRAASLYKEALEIQEDVGDQWGFIETSINLGELALLRKDYEAGGQLLDRALELAADAFHRMVALHNRALVYLHDGRPDLVRVLHREALQLAVASGDKENIAYSLEGLAVTFLEEPLRSARLLGAARALQQQVGFTLSPIEQELHNETWAALERTLTSEAFEAALAEGAALSADDSWLKDC